MLYVYHRKEDIPKDKTLIEDVEMWFEMPENPPEDVRTLIREVEHGEYLDDTYFVDRFGGNLYHDFMSTGCKAAIVAVLNQDKVINTNECGRNVLRLLFKNKMSGNLYIPSPTILDMCTTAYRIFPCAIREKYSPLVTSCIRS